MRYCSRCANLRENWLRAGQIHLDRRPQAYAMPQGKLRTVMESSLGKIVPASGDLGSMLKEDGGGEN